MTKKSWAVVIVATAFLSACGGSDDPPPVTEAVPSSASESATGFIAYLQELVLASADMLEPVDISTVTPPADNSSEPTLIN
ncbi:MAG: hypothetical protein ABIR94_10270 [Rubrivivax sp.]